VKQYSIADAIPFERKKQVTATTLEEGNYLYLSGVILVIFDLWNLISAVSPF